MIVPVSRFQVPDEDALIPGGRDAGVIVNESKILHVVPMPQQYAPELAGFEIPDTDRVVR
jgi:hypothetical protein